MVQLTEREHLILSAAEKCWKAVTQLGARTQKLHNVRIYLVRRSRKVHVSGGNYHAGMQELLKLIRQTTTRWEQEREAHTSVVGRKLRTHSVVLLRSSKFVIPFRLFATSEKLLNFNNKLDFCSENCPAGRPREPMNTESWCKTASSIPGSSQVREMEHVDVKPVIVFSTNEQMSRGRDETELRQTENIKLEPILFYGSAEQVIKIKVEQDDEDFEQKSKLSSDNEIANPMSTPNTDHDQEGNNETQENVEASADKEDKVAKVDQSGNAVSSDTAPQNVDSYPVTNELRQDGNKRPTTSEMIQNLEPGHHFATEVTKGSLKATAICIKPTPAGYSELFL